MDIPQLLTQLEPWAQRIEEWDDVPRIYYNLDSDAIIAATIFARVFLDLEKPCQLTPIGNNWRITDELKKKPSIFLGISNELIESVSDFENAIILPNISDVQHLDDENTNILKLEHWLENDDKITLSAIAYFLCNPIAKSLDYIVRLPLISYIAKFGIRSFEGVHEMICKDAIDGDIAEFQKRFIFLGSQIFTIPELLEYSQYPFLPGLSGNESNVTTLLAKSGIELTRGNETRYIQDLSKQETTELNTKLVMFMSSQKGHQEDEMVFIRDVIVFKDEEKKGLTSNSLDFGRCIIDGINRKQIGNLCSVLIGNRGSKLIQLQKLFVEERKAISVSFQIIRDHEGEVEDLGGLRVYNADRKVSWYNASLTSGMALSNGLVKPDKPFAVVSPGPNDKQTIGFRASKSHKIGDGLVSIIQSALLQSDYSATLNGTKLSATVIIDKSISRELLLSVNKKLVELS